VQLAPPCRSKSIGCSSFRRRRVINRKARRDHRHDFIEIPKNAALNMIGRIRLRQEDLTEDEAKKCLGYLEEARKASVSSGDVLGVVKLEDTIADFKEIGIERFGDQEAFGELESMELRIERRRSTYQLIVENYDEVSSLQAGLDLAVLLSNANHIVEAWRLLKRLIAISTQYHGREHSYTEMLEQTLAKFKCNNIHVVKLRSLSLLFRAIGYEDNKYVLRGPIGVPEEQMQTLRVYSSDIILKSYGVPISSLSWIE
jgi:hypothetical protein